MAVFIAFLGAALVALGLALAEHPSSRVCYIAATAAFAVAAILTVV